MSRFSIPAAASCAAVLALTFAASAGAQDQALPPGTLTVVGSADVAVTPQDRKSNASIAAAVADARKKALPLAIGNGRGRAATLASVSGLTLGPLLAIAETSVPANGFPYFIGPYGVDGTFGPGKYCGTVTRATFKTVAGVRKRTGLHKTHTCRIPPEASRSVTMTFAAGGPPAA